VADEFRHHKDVDFAGQTATIVARHVIGWFVGVLIKRQGIYTFA
jgi:hypothetical protein